MAALGRLSAQGRNLRLTAWPLWAARPLRRQRALRSIGDVERAAGNFQA